MTPVRVAVDAMGGDRAPEEIVAGAREAASADVVPVLFGPRDVLEPLASGLEVVHAEQVVAMDEKPSDAVREKRESSLFLACRAVHEGTADAVVGAGNTGAMLAAGLLEIRRLPDVHRPAIAVPIPALGGPSILIDSGANADARPEHLVQFAHMGAVFAEDIAGLRTRRWRSSPSARSRRRATSSSARPTPSSPAPPALLRRQRRGARPAAQGGRRGRLRRLHGEHGPEAARGHDPDHAPGLSGRGHGLAARQAGRAPDPTGCARPADAPRPDTYGGAYLLGLRGLVVIAHGNSSATAIANAVRYAARGVTGGVVEQVAERLAARVREGAAP